MLSKNRLRTADSRKAGVHLTVLGRAAILARLFRIGNCALLGSLAAFSVLVTQHGEGWTVFHLALLFTSWSALAATAYAINDLVDRINDRVNRPKRYLQQVDRTPFWIIACLCIVALAAIVTGTFVPLAGFLLLELGWSCCAIGYSFGLKRRSGLLANLLTAFCVATSGAPGLLQSFTPRIVSLLPVLFLLMLAREIWKDIEDEPGDIAAGLRTLPILRGRTFAARGASIVAAAGFLAFILGRPSGHNVDAISVSLGIIGLIGSVLLFVRPHIIPAGIIQRLHRYAAIIVFAVFIGGSGIL
jgi:geranylgeranylglycerol-phosphate geranylgeranyltransferase